MEDLEETIMMYHELLATLVEENRETQATIMICHVLMVRRMIDKSSAVVMCLIMIINQTAHDFCQREAISNPLKRNSNN